MSVALYKLAVSEVAVGGAAVTPVFAGISGGYIWNPQSAADQGISVIESIFVDLSGENAVLRETATTVPVLPGQIFILPANLENNVSVNAATAGHRFGGIIVQPPTPYPPTPQSGVFPPLSPATLTQTIPAYLYEEYNDDESLQAFFGAYNGFAQAYVSWFATIGLPIYTSTQISGALLDWVAQGIYGFVRPAISAGETRAQGAYDTYAYNTLAYNARKLREPTNIVATTDDVFRRCITWNFYKGDGYTFNVRYLKRRLMRFMLGTNGTAPNIDQTYPISVTFGPDGGVAIRISVGTRNFLKGTYNTFAYNTRAYDTPTTQFISPPNPLPNEAILADAIDSGALQLPFQFTFSILV
jgi:hypothetical protein